MQIIDRLTALPAVALVALGLGFASAPAAAAECPEMMATVDEALVTNQVSDQVLADVEDLREQAAAAYQAGDDAACVAALDEALDLLDHG